MKYFTTEWWVGGCEDPPMIIEQYQAYLTSVRAQLPAELVDFEDNHTLHDSQVKSIVSDFNNRTVVMALNGWNQRFERQIRYTLNYLGVLQFHQQLPKPEHLESELGDLGYVELELVESAIEMRMLFASSAEFRITFTDFSFEHVGG